MHKVLFFLILAVSLAVIVLMPSASGMRGTLSHEKLSVLKKCGWRQRRPARIVV